MSYKWSRNNLTYTRSPILYSLQKPQTELSTPQIDCILYQYPDMSGARTEKGTLTRQRQDLPKRIFEYTPIVILNIQIPFAVFVPIPNNYT